MSDTIAAIATGGAVSAIGVIRLSGDGAIAAVSRVFIPVSGRSVAGFEDRKLVYGELFGKNGEVIDKCLCTVSRAPNTYTGEDTAEIHCHGSPTVLRLALESLFAAGARQALPGEFTKRAFLNGRMDLTQAEAVIDLIASETEEIAKNAAGQLGGAITRKTDAIYDSLVDIISHYHAVLDYPDEDIEAFEMLQYEDVLGDAARSLTALAATFERGRIMKSGARAVILGKPNVGKSTLLNALLGYDRAIVTPIPGTTRDTIEEAALVGGVKLRLTDTAGLRESGDAVEKIGVDRARAAAKDADLALVLIDSSADATDVDWQAYRAAQAAKHIILVKTKRDLAAREPGQDSPLCGDLRPPDAEVFISALTGEGLPELEGAILGLFPKSEATPGEIITNSRQFDAITRALASVLSAIEAIGQGSTPDIVLTETEAALSAIGELTGKTVREDVTSRIFERFCVGK